MSENNGHRKVWVTAAVSTTLLLLLLLRRKRQQLKAARQNAANVTRVALHTAMQRSVLPAFVHPASLPLGWGVAPPVFYPPHCAVIPLVLPSEMAEIERSSHLVNKVSADTNSGDSNSPSSFAFILCSHTGIIAATAGTATTTVQGDTDVRADSVEARQKKLLADLLAHHPLLKEQFAPIASQWVPLVAVPPASEKRGDDAAADAEHGYTITPVFTHLLQGPDNCVLLSGVNGPYFIVAVLSGFGGALADAATAVAGDAVESPNSSPKALTDARKTSAATLTSTASTDPVLNVAGVVHGVAQATFKVPLTSDGNTNSPPTLAAARLPGGAAFAVHRGYYRVLCVRNGKGLELRVPTEVLVRSKLVNLSLVTPTSSPLVPCVSGEVQIDALPEALLTLTAAPSPLATEDAVKVRVTEEVFATLVENPEDAATTLWKASRGNPEATPMAAAAFKDITACALAEPSHGRTNMMTMVYVQPQFGVLFSVHPLSSVVYEPWMTDLPRILYYPLGDHDSDDGNGEGCISPPRMSIEYVVELPETWEMLKKDDEELRHNVLFHFTNWEAATVSSSMTEISGIRCVMFHEVRDGRRCRSYILPRASTVLIVRWETALDTWEKYLPVFQQTLDTLHVDATAMTK